MYKNIFDTEIFMIDCDFFMLFTKSFNLENVMKNKIFEKK